MMTIISKLYNSTPKQILNAIRNRLLHRRPQTSAHLKVTEELRRRFSVYQTPNLRGISPEKFTQYVQSRIGTIDHHIEEYSPDELDRQRDSSVKFTWGHNHDFGSFKMKGLMGDRHINEMANFMAIFPISFDDFKNSNVLDVGCWTGGTTMLLAALGSRVVAIEEVKKYADMASFLIESFALNDRVSVNCLSIYDCNSEKFFNRFDIVYFPGVIYHLSDPVLALRILFNSLKIGGIILVETEGIQTKKPLCRVDGTMIWKGGTKENLDRTGWNRFVPSPSALHIMMQEAGFDEIKTLWLHGRDRVYGFGRKVAHVGICKAGLSDRHIR
ncbi:MAG: DUF1698 domain-containing protein [Smithella sp.]|jgi:2-polyprenyl-3-methyl-5-hydroxy-6-metoxy-1,4-benzoquinol methylase